MPDTASLCGICGKEKNTGRDGSLTQFVFRFDTCRCELPSLAKFQKKPEQPGNGNKNASQSNGNGSAHGHGNRGAHGCGSDTGTDAPYSGNGGTSTVLEAHDHSTQADNDSRQANNFSRDGSTEEELQLPPGSFPAERYGPIKELGRGAAGTVYLCKDRLLADKHVAVKVLHTIDAEKLLAFQHEAKAISRLNHPNIILGLDFGATTDGAPFLVMEYCEGSTLEQFYKYSQETKARLARDKKARLEREKNAAQHAWSDKNLESSAVARPDSSQPNQETITPTGLLTIAEAVDVFSAICRALTYAHSHGVYHRDIKPSNVLLQREEGDRMRVRLIDFGIASVKRATHEPTLFQGKTIAGTPAYMSPDVALGRSYDARSEIYSLGCMIFEALSGKLPFRGESPLETLQMHAHTKPPVLSEICYGNECNGLSKIVQRCLEKDPDLRFQSTSDLRSALEGVTTYDTSAGKELDTLSVRPHPKKRASTMPLYAVSIGLVALLVGSLVMFVAEPEFIFSRLENLTSRLESKQTKETQANQRPPKPAAASSSSRPIIIETAPSSAPAPGKRAKPKAASSSPPEIPLALDKTGDPLPDVESGPVYLEKRPGEEFDNYIVQGHIQKADQLKILQGKKYITRLDLRFDDLFGDTCKYLEELPLVRINFTGSDLDEQSFVHIGRIKTLVQLTFQDCNGVTDDALRHLEALPDLLFLRVGDTAITDKGIDSLLKLRKLKELRMSGCTGVTSSGLVKLKALKNLETLTCRNCKIDERFLKELDKFKSLNYIGVSDIDNNSVKYLVNLKAKTLAIGSGHRLTDRGLIELAKARNLRTLMIVPSKLTTSFGINTFKLRNPKCNVILGDDEGQVRMMYELKPRSNPNEY